MAWTAGSGPPMETRAVSAWLLSPPAAALAALSLSSRSAPSPARVVPPESFCSLSPSCSPCTSPDRLSSRPDGTWPCRGSPQRGQSRVAARGATAGRVSTCPWRSASTTARVLPQALVVMALPLTRPCPSTSSEPSVDSSLRFLMNQMPSSWERCFCFANALRRAAGHKGKRGG